MTPEDIKRLKGIASDITPPSRGNYAFMFGMLPDLLAAVKQLDEAIKELNLCRPYRSLFASQANELIAVRAERDRLREALDDFAEQDCTYPHQPCLSVHPSILGHGVCDGCKARMALQESIGAKEENNS